MERTPFQFKSFVWPDNPGTVEFTQAVRTQEIALPEDRFLLRESGRAARRIVCAGFFAGTGAQETFDALRAVFEQGGEGTLFLPGHPPLRAVMTGLSRRDVPGPSCIGYTAAFTQAVCRRPVRGRERCVYRVRAGETLWQVAAAQGMSMEELLRCNPQVSGPWDIEEGDLLWIFRG